MHVPTESTSSSIPAIPNDPKNTAPIIYGIRMLTKMNPIYFPLSDPGVGSLSFPGSEGKEAIETSHLKLGAFVEV